MTSDVFGQAGDFITSPEISQVFGEVLFIGCKIPWNKIQIYIFLSFTMIFYHDLLVRVSMVVGNNDGHFNKKKFNVLFFILFFL